MPLFAATVFLSAFLLFLVQPLVGRVLLPWFGGAPSVWTTCMLFFQVLLLAGYGWAHLVSRQPPRRQAALHLSMLGAAALAFVVGAARWGAPIVPDASMKPPDGLYPTARLLLLLAQTVGLPYLALSATGPLLQAWYARVYPDRSAWRLYALSNTGSMLALFAYPFGLEPLLGLRAQGWAFSLGFVLFFAGCARAALRARGAPMLPASPASASSSASNSTSTSASPEPAAPAASQAIARPSARQWAVWIALAAVPSLSLLAITNQLCQEVAVFPMLWVLPLATYLATFILCFESNRWYRRTIFVPLLGVLSVMALLLFFGEVRSDLAVPLTNFLLLLFAIGMICHGELARLRPAPAHLTSFYLAVSIGGACGGLFVGLAAPALFASYFEFDLCILGAWVAVIATSPKAGAGADARQRAQRRSPLFMLANASVLLVLVAEVMLRQGNPGHGLLAKARGFYGVIKVESATRGAFLEHSMSHGRIVHGAQYQDAAHKPEPVTYFTRNSGVGRAIANHPRRLAGQPMRIGIIGLGVGVLAAYGQPGDEIRFYEINPDVIRLAQTPQYFSYLSDSKAKIDVVLGDARIMLEHELAQGGSRGYDLFVLDAFSSDSIPAHLLTVQAFQLYLAHLRSPDSIIALHVSNRMLDLGPVIRRTAQELNLPLVELLSQAMTAQDPPLEQPAHWILLSRTKEVFDRPDFNGLERVKRKPVLPRLWTDDYTNILTALGEFKG
ncbi:MAG TPA: ferrichrome ABC transporter permease [Myxococcales bacterium]|jgi:hypothetical protein